jgi:outer membrane protein assembly factor BamA
VVAGYVFKAKVNDEVSPPSAVGMAVAATNNGSRGIGLGGRLYLNQNRYQTTLAVAKGRVDYDFYGIGRLPNRPSVAVPLRTEGFIFYSEFLRNIGKSFFLGGRYQHRRLSSSVENGLRPPGGFEIPDIDLESRSAALGVHLQRDSRDSTFYPTKGMLFDAIGDFFDQSWGSRREYQTYDLSYSGYRQIAPGQVVAYQALGCSARGSVPFYDLCFYGAMNQLRGYTAGEFQDRLMLTTQAEYRLELPKRLGLVAFAGVGGVAGKWSEFRMDELLPGGGIGLRFKLDKKNHINYRIDFAVGRDGHTLTIGIGEAF